MTTHVIGCYFDQAIYERMSLVLRATARAYIPDALIDIRRIPAPLTDLARSVIEHWKAANSDKLRHWVDCCDKLPDGAQAILLDVDTFIRDDPSDAWDTPFDVGLTKRRESHKYPFNGGVVFIRVNHRSRRFMRQWLAANEYLRKNPQAHRPWRLSHGGMNQAALGFILAQGVACKVAHLPTWRFNACDASDWADIEGAAIVHVKADMRKALEGAARPTEVTRSIIEQWWRLEQQCCVKSESTIASGNDYP